MKPCTHKLISSYGLPEACLYYDEKAGCLSMLDYPKCRFAEDMRQSRVQSCTFGEQVTL